MRKALIFVGLVLLWSGCPASRGKGPTARPAPLAKAPERVTEDTYAEQRDRYDALPLRAPGRARFREVLLDYLLERAAARLERGDESVAIKSFGRGLTLFDPTEVYTGNVGPHPRLARLAERIERHFSPRGDETHVLLGLGVQMVLEPDEATHLAEYRRVISWLKQTDGLVHGGHRRWISAIRALEKTREVWPAARVVEDLRKLYVEQKLGVSRSIQMPHLRHLTGAISVLYRTGVNIARLYLWVDRPREALEHLREVATESATPDENLRVLLEEATKEDSAPRDTIRLADSFSRRDPAVALRICRHALAEQPDSAALHWCVGRLAARLKRTHLAIGVLRRAVELKPDNPIFAEKLAQQLQRRLFRMIGNEELERARDELRRIEHFYAEATRRLGRPLKPPLAMVHYAVGQGLYNAGRVEAAGRAFRKSLASKPSPPALYQLAEIEVKRGKPDGAMPLLARAEKVPMETASTRIYWQARIEGLRGRAHAVAGRSAASRKAHRLALDAWSELRTLGLMPTDLAEAHVFEARSHYALGEKASAMDALDRAIDVQPDRKETYADVIALLVTHGHLPEALDAYHRALGREEVSEYLKTYCSFWIISLARRAGLPPDPLAIAHLQRVMAKKWYTELAQFMLGKTEYDALLRRARTPGNRAELYFYRAEQLLADGQLEPARELWRKVLQTNMMAFYEYDMAAHNLRVGPATVSTHPIDRQPARAASDPPRGQRTEQRAAPSNQP